MRRSLAAAIGALALSSSALAQSPPPPRDWHAVRPLPLANPPVPLACTVVRPDGRDGAPGLNFVAIQDGRVTMLLGRQVDGQSNVTDFAPVANRPGTSFFVENYEVRIGQKPVSIFILASIVQDGLIMVERWRREGQDDPQYSHYHLRCAR